MIVAKIIFFVICHFVVSPLFGNSHTGLLPDAKSTDFTAWSVAKPSVTYSEPIILAGKLIFFCSSVQQLGQLASKDELRSEEVATVHAKEVGTVDEEAEDEVTSQCGESDSLPIPVSICSGVSSVVLTLLLVGEK
jgi:hypothetical protein